MTPRTAEQFEKIRKAKSEQILMAALELFATHGYHGTSISAIAKHAGISKGLLYNYFESKESILIHLCEDYIEMIVNLIPPIHDDEILCLEMNRFIDSFSNSLLHHRELWKLFFKIEIQPDVRQVIVNKLAENTIISNFIKLIYKYLADRFKDPQAEFLYLTSLIMGFSVQYVFVPEFFSQKDLEVMTIKVKSILQTEKQINNN